MLSIIYAYENIAVITLKRAKYWSLGKAVESVVQQVECRHEWHLDDPKVYLLVVASLMTTTLNSLLKTFLRWKNCSCVELIFTLYSPK